MGDPEMVTLDWGCWVFGVWIIAGYRLVHLHIGPLCVRFDLHHADDTERGE